MVWGPWTLVIFLGVGILLYPKMSFFPNQGVFILVEPHSRTAYIGQKRQKQGQEESGCREGTWGGQKGISQFQSVCTALAATVGTGNIAGVATALTAGGPGALFWMWVSARDWHDNRLCGDHAGNTGTGTGISDGHYICGPFIYMERGLGIKGNGSAVQLSVPDRAPLEWAAWSRPTRPSAPWNTPGMCQPWPAD